MLHILVSSVILGQAKAPVLPAVELKLEAVASAREPGSPRTFVVTLTNRSKKVLHLMHPGDGSESHWRNPHTGWSSLTNAKAIHPATAPKYGMGRCGNVNPISETEFFDLAPGQSMPIGGWIMSPPLVPGRNRVVFYYEIVPNAGVPKGLPSEPMNSALLAKYKALTPVRTRSNEVIVNVPMK